MEEFIIYVIIVLSIIINIYRNFQKQKKADAKRAVVKPAQTAPPANSYPSGDKKPQPKQAKAVKRAKHVKSAVEEALEAIENENPSTLYNYASLETAEGYNNYLDERKNLFGDNDAFSDLMSIDEEMSEVADESATAALNLFGTKDEIKKAIIYSSVFERKY